ncbi:hypothetical protein BU15DRAFT_29939, partial [Melanogaster broomeanus]
DPIHVPVRIKKATRLFVLQRAVLDATDNATLSKVVAEFTTFLKESGSSKAYQTGIIFLDALFKQSTDPSVFVVPMRTSRTRSTEQEKPAKPQPAHVKLDSVATLKRDVVVA